jgi:hypothetical protein
MGQVIASPASYAPSLAGTPKEREVLRIDVSMLPAGLYYVTLRGENGSVVEKFVKM